MLTLQNPRRVSVVQDARHLLDRRIEVISGWLRTNALECAREQRHLDEGKPERQYWHYGYLTALRDVQKLLGLCDETSN